MTNITNKNTKNKNWEYDREGECQNSQDVHQCQINHNPFSISDWSEVHKHTESAMQPKLMVNLPTNQTVRQ